MTLQKYIRNRRRKLRLSQGELAKRIGLSRFFLNKIENGKVGVPSKRISSFIEALDLDEDFVIDILVDAFENHAKNELQKYVRKNEQRSTP